MIGIEQGWIVQRVMEEYARAAGAVERAPSRAVRLEIERIKGELELALATYYASPDRFGLCADCGRPISIERLQLMPWARRCLGCALVREMEPAPA